MSPTKPPKKILVTGGGGYIGSHAVHHLIDAGYTPIVIDDFSTGHKWAIPQNTPIITGNIGDADLLQNTFKTHQIHAVMHFAASVIVPESIINPALYYTNNTANTLTLLKEMQRANIGNLIFSSTAAVYGEPKTSKPIAEDAPTNPINPYGHSKLLAEIIIKDMAKAHGLKAIILRYFNVAGADRLGRAGQSTEGATHLIKVVAEAAVGKRERVKIFGTDYPTPDGTAIRDYIHVDDLISAHIASLNHLNAANCAPGTSEIFNCGYGHGFSVLEVIAAMQHHTNTKIITENAPRRQGDPTSLISDASKIRAHLNWQPQAQDLAQITSDALKWEKSCRKPS